MQVAPIINVAPHPPLQIVQPTIQQSVIQQPIVHSTIQPIAQPIIQPIAPPTIVTAPPIISRPLAQSVHFGAPSQIVT